MKVINIKTQYKWLITSLAAIMAIQSVAFAADPLMGNVTFDESGKNYIKVDLFDVKLENGNTETFIKFIKCRKASAHSHSCREIDPLHRKEGYKLSTVMGNSFMNSPQPEYMNYNPMKYTKKWGAAGAAVGALGILGAYIVVITLPIGGVVGVGAGAIRDSYEYFHRNSLTRDLATGQYKIKDFEGLSNEIERALGASF